MSLLNFGGGKSSSSSSSFVDAQQQPFLDFLRNSGQGLARNQMPQIGRQATQQSQDLYGQGQQMLGGLQQNPFMSSLQTQAQGNPALMAQQTQQLGQDIGQFTNEQLLPGIRRDATAVGALGGSRQGVAEGMAAQGAQRAFSGGVTDLMGMNNQLANQAGAAGAGIQAQSNLGGLSSLGDLFNLGMSPFGAQFQPLMSMNQLVGAPTVLDKSKSGSFNASLGLF